MSCDINTFNLTSKVIFYCTHIIKTNLCYTKNNSLAILINIAIMTPIKPKIPPISKPEIRTRNPHNIPKTSTATSAINSLIKYGIFYSTPENVT